MGAYFKMQMTDKESLCQNIYTDEIIGSADYLREYEKYAKVGKKGIPVTCYTNFRDSLFHFRKMANCSEEHEIMQQAFAVKEHAHRARTDAMTSVLFYFSRVANSLMNEESIDADTKMQLRILLHKMKNIIMISRMDGMMMPDVSNPKIAREDITAVLEEFFDLVQEKCFIQFVEINDRLGEEKSNCL
ncbi:MAG: hypothetical protein K2P65_14610 [Lachnospiraceae bacterium]|nr:hypothetical protein [Lachnospiraceae bacterium]